MAAHVSILHEVPNSPLPVASDSSELPQDFALDYVREALSVTRFTDLLRLPLMTEINCEDTQGNDKAEASVPALKWAS